MPAEEPQINVMIARMAYGGHNCSGLTDWLIQSAIYLHTHPRIKDVFHLPIDRSPVSAARNSIITAAHQYRANLLVMVDADIVPPPNFLPTVLARYFDAYKLSGGSGLGAAIYAAPAICRDGRPNVFRWGQSPLLHDPDPYLTRATLGDVSREGVESVAAVGTGCIAIDMNVFSRLSTPYFYIEYRDELETEVATGEDVCFTRDAGMAGIPVLALWECWCRHRKELTLEVPPQIPADSIPSKLREVFERSVH